MRLLYTLAAIMLYTAIPTTCQPSGTPPSGSTNGTAPSGNSTAPGGNSSSSLSGANQVEDSANIESTGFLSSCQTSGEHEEEEGPYFIDVELNRSNVTLNGTSTVQGVPIVMTLQIYNSTETGCVVLPNVQVDTWMADPYGIYSDEDSEGTAGYTYLRGYQISDASGYVTFQAIYPGWYSGRAPHIHIMVRQYSNITSIGNTTAATIYSDTTRLYFNDTFTNEIYYNNYPYSTRAAERDTYNNNDTTFSSELLVNYYELNGTVYISHQIGLPLYVRSAVINTTTTPTSNSTDNTTSSLVSALTSDSAVPQIGITGVLLAAATALLI